MSGMSIGPALGGICLPSRERLVNGFAFGQHVEIGREMIDTLTVPEIVRADFEFRELVENVEPGDGDRCEAIDPL